PVDQFKGEKDHIADGFHRMDRDDVRMIESRRRAGLAFEPLSAIRVSREIRIQDLERDATLKLGVLGEIDLAHASLSEEFDDAVMAKGRAHHVERSLWRVTDAGQEVRGKGSVHNGL